MRETLPLGGHHIFDRLVARRLQRFYDRLAVRNPDAKDILDIGCGPGHLAAAIARSHPQAHVRGLDLDPVQVRIARKHEAPNLSFDQGASHQLPLPDASLDWVITTESFHHWSRPQESLDEIHRVLRPGGTFWIVEGAGDMTRGELEAWTGRRPFPGLTWWVRAIFTTHGYSTRRLHAELLPILRQGPFGEPDATREDGWWIIEMRKAAALEPQREPVQQAV